eukprot:5767278-Amphidinium_carterae.2
MMLANVYITFVERTMDDNCHGVWVFHHALPSTNLVALSATGGLCIANDWRRSRKDATVCCHCNLPLLLLPLLRNYSITRAAEHPSASMQPHLTSGICEDRWHCLDIEHAVLGSSNIRVAAQ